MGLLPQLHGPASDEPHCLMDPFKCQDAHLLGFRVFSPAVSQGYPGLNVAFPGDGMRWVG